MSTKSFRPFLCCFAVCLLIFTALFMVIQRYREHTQLRDIRYLTLSKSKEITDAIYELLFKTEALATLVIQGNGEIREFDKIAPVMLNKPAIRNILVAPGGVVSNVYPRTGNEKLIGFDLFGPGNGNREALLARDTGRLTLGGPFKGVQGGHMLVGRLPVYVDRQEERSFWGLVSVTLNFPGALESVHLEDLEKQGYACEIWRINPDTGQRQVILSSGMPLRSPVEKEFSLLNADWTISIASTEVWYAAPYFYAYACSALLISVLLALSVQNYNDMKRLKCSMEEMAMEDALTGLPNRRAAFEELRERAGKCRKRGGSFVLGYLDLNFFKEINDTCGHQAGDAVLQETARRLRAVLGRHAFIARMGGDEFVVILSGSFVCREEAEQLFAAVKDAMRQDFSFKQHRLNFSISTGFAIYPHDADDVEKLATLADRAMYDDKSREHEMKGKASGHGARTDVSAGDEATMTLASARL